MTVRLVLRDLVSAALAKQPLPITAEQLADLLHPFGCGDPRQIGKALRQLEAQGAAVRHPGHSPRGGRAPGLWTASG
ncbi:hypothetical protein [Streptomyces flaveus]|uniref:hypothetical protein n=1 Tax=Streptomyces flaveus TaxID=66370 RepID=UPI00166FF995|nr:hypothetical protein [Streptomyces flaveus]